MKDPNIQELRFGKWLRLTSSIYEVFQAYTDNHFQTRGHNLCQYLCDEIPEWIGWEDTHTVMVDKEFFWEKVLSLRSDFVRDHKLGYP